MIVPTQKIVDSHGLGAHVVSRLGWRASAWSGHRANVGSKAGAWGSVRVWGWLVRLVDRLAQVMDPCAIHHPRWWTNSFITWTSQPHTPLTVCAHHKPDACVPLRWLITLTPRWPTLQPCAWPTPNPPTPCYSAILRFELAILVQY
jgi:hypothetical protein